MIALTILQPWAWAIRHLQKRVENRMWAPPANLIGRQLCIHAGTLKRDCRPGIWDEVFLPFPLLSMRGIEFPGDRLPTREELLAESGAIVAVATLDRVSRWLGDDPIEQDVFRTEDEYGWVLRDVLNIEPVPCRGNRKLWNVPPEVASLVEQRLGEARRAA